MDFEIKGMSEGFPREVVHIRKENKGKKGKV